MQPVRQSERDSSGLSFISMTWKGQRIFMRKRSVLQFLMSRPVTMLSSIAADVLFALSGRGLSPIPPKIKQCCSLRFQA
jgi:hypothetical protein